MKGQVAEKSAMIENMHHEMSQAKSDKAKTEDQVLIQDLQINEAERMLKVMRQARDRAERLVANERQARQEAERLSQERQGDLIRQNNELRATLLNQRGKGGNH